MGGDCSVLHLNDSRRASAAPSIQPGPPSELRSLAAHCNVLVKIRASYQASPMMAILLPTWQVDKDWAPLLSAWGRPGLDAALAFPCP